MFATKSEAITYETTVRSELRAGTHVADSATVTLSEAARLWIERAELDGFETSTVRQYKQHANLHINPVLGARKLSQLSRPAVEAFKHGLLKTTPAPW